MQLNKFETTEDFGKILVVGKKSPGPNSAVWFDARPGCCTAFEGPKGMKQSFTVRPSSLKTSIDSKTTFEINLQVSPEDHADFFEAAKRLDSFVVKSVFDRKGELLPSKAAVIASEDALVPIYVNGKCIKNGATSADGTKYPDLLKLKITGKWNAYVDELVTKQAVMRGTTKTVPDYCTWKPRVDAVESGETKFYLWSRVNEDGNDVFTDKVTDPVTGMTRLVGPQDCLPGSDITPVFAPSCLYFNEGFGMSLVAKALFIKHRTNIVDTSKAVEAFLPSSVTVESTASVSASAAGSKRPRSGGEDVGTQTEDSASGAAKKEKKE